MDVAEAVKLTENIFRSVNIALGNELRAIYRKMDIDIWEVIEAAKSIPFGYMPFYPGPGLGGHCIPIDHFISLGGQNRLVKKLDLSSSPAKSTRRCRKRWRIRLERPYLKNRVRKFCALRCYCWGRL